MRLEDPRREQAAWCLAQGNNQSETSRITRVNRATINRWVKDPAIKARIAEISRLETEDIGDVAAEAERGLARLVPIAEAVVEAALKGEGFGAESKVPTSQQHANALKTIELARKLEPKATGITGAPSLVDMISAADEARTIG